MDGPRFDALLRALVAEQPRRGLARLIGGLLLGGPLGLQAVATADAKRKKGKKGKKGKKKRKRKRKRKRAARRGCTPNCAGKACGDDGCGGECGPCVRGSCQGGVCVCPAGQELCDGICLVACGSGEARDPSSCGCCREHRRDCSADSDCCSNLCDADDGCVGFDGFAACSFDAQCDSGTCEAGTCTCRAGTEACDGRCVGPCVDQFNAFDPIQCRCCVRPGVHIPNICANSACCSGSCSADTCMGLPDNAACSFDAQCDSGDCHNNLGICTGGIGP